MSASSSPTDTEPPSSESIPVGPRSPSSAPSSVTSEPPASTGSPAFKPADGPVTKPLMESLSEENLTSRVPQAPVPSDFPGKKSERSAVIIKQGDFEPNNHFYARCRTSLRYGSKVT